jgi:hypothetical protein
MKGTHNVDTSISDPHAIVTSMFIAPLDVDSSVCAGADMGDGSKGPANPLDVACV